MLTNDDKKFLELYSDSEYEKPSVTVDAVIFRIKSEENKNYRKLPQKKLQVYLTKRQYPPFKGQFSVVGTFIDLKHELGETMKLCVKNKVNLDNYYFEQLFTFGDKSRDPRTRVLSISYMLLTNCDEELENGEWFDVELNETQLNTTNTKNGYITKKQIEMVLKNQNQKLENSFEITNTKTGLEEIKTIDIKNNTLAFDHTKIIYYALERLKNKLEYREAVPKRPAL